MKLVVKLALTTDAAQAAALLATLERFNAACDWVAGRAYADRTANRFVLQRRYYRRLRSDFGRPAQLAVRAIAKVCEALRRDPRLRPWFRPRGAVVYDQRNSRLIGSDRVSLSTLAGRMVLPLVFGAHQRPLVERGYLVGQMDLLYDARRRRFYLHATAEVPVPEASTPADYLGVDLGIVNLAADSDGGRHRGEDVERARRRYAHRRRNLQRKGTKASRRKLALLRHRQARFQRDTNHCISKRIVAVAEGTGRGLALEDLRGIRDRTTVRRRQRARHANWSFSQLRTFLAYKARLVGVPVVFVDPRYTSQTCPACGHVAKANRRTQPSFRCVSCGLAGPADVFAARVIAARARAAVMPPNGSVLSVGVTKVSDAPGNSRAELRPPGRGAAPGTSFFL